MANKKIEMSKVRKCIVLHHQGQSKSFISKYLHLSRNTVKKYINLYKILNLNINTINNKSDDELEKLFSKAVPELTPKLQAVYDIFPYMEKELKKTGVTKQIIWEEYIAKHPDGLRSSQFMDRYNIWSKKVNPVMHMNHKSGDKMYIDYAGKTLQIVDKETGEIKDVQFFVAILGASGYTYAEASMSQQKEDFIKSVENSLHFYEGVPAAIVPDNLKSAVTKSSKYEPTINETFLDFSDHYGTVILPARAYKPKDKSLAEGAVKILYTRIYSVLRNNTYHCLDELNNDIWTELDKHNSKKLSGRKISRIELFKETDKPELKPLPKSLYEIKYQSFATALPNAHVLLSKDKHYYSVPYQYIKKKVKLIYTSEDVEIYHKYNLIAKHKRNPRPYNYTTVNKHMASSHRFVTDWNPQKFIDWAASIGEPVKAFICELLEHKQHPEQAYKSCIGVLSMTKKVEKQRLINACKRANDFNIYNYKIIKTILEKGLDKLDYSDNDDHNIPEHKNIRGNNYYN